MRQYVLLFILVISGCSSLQSIEGTPNEVQDLIISGQALESGDQVVITTIQGASYDFRVEEVTGEAVIGENLVIPINEIESVELVELDPVSTVGATAIASAWGLFVLAFIALAAW